jgi:effector-binding domain-containing protein
MGHHHDHDFTAEVREQQSQPTVAARVTAKQADLGELFGRYLGEVMGRIQSSGGTPAGAPFGRYFEFQEELVDVEIGFPVAAPVADLPSLTGSPAGEIGNSELPGGRAAFTVHRGSYEGLPDTWNHLREWIDANGHEVGEGPWESYVDDPGDMSDIDNVRTEIIWPIR